MKKVNSKARASGSEVLSADLLAQLQAAAALPDDEINTSDPDAPEVTDWSDAVRAASIALSRSSEACASTPMCSPSTKPKAPDIKRGSTAICGQPCCEACGAASNLHAAGRPGRHDRLQRFSLCRATDEPFVVIARSISDAASLFIPLLRIASSLPRAITAAAVTAGAMTTGLMLARHRYNEHCWIDWVPLDWTFPSGAMNKHRTIPDCRPRRLRVISWRQ
jgi:hypothetical protein